MKKLGMIVNAHKPGAVAMARRLLQWGRDRGLSFLLPHPEASVLTAAGLSDEEWLGTVEVAIVVGGDGTFLRAARYVLDAGTLLYGINLGHLGFLSSGKPDSAEEDLENILNGRYNVLERRLLHCVLYRNGAPLHTLYALNDFVLSKNAIARLLHIEVRFDDRFFGILPAKFVDRKSVV